MAFDQYKREENERLKFDEDDDNNTVVRVVMVI